MKNLICYLFGHKYIEIKVYKDNGLTHRVFKCTRCERQING